MLTRDRRGRLSSTGMHPAATPPSSYNRLMRRMFAVLAAVLAAVAALSLHGQSITTVAGGGSDDGQLATAIPVTAPRGIAVDSTGNIYFAESSGRVRRIDATTGVVKTIAGNGASGFSGD